MPRPVVGAYVCPGGIFAVECQRRGSALRIGRSFGTPGHLRSPREAAEQLTRALSAASISRASVAIALRGYGVVHHVLLHTAAPDAVQPMVDRELRRLDPALTDSVSAVATLSSSAQATAVDSASARLAAAVPASVVDTFEQQLAAEGHSLRHVTALPAAMNRLAEEFDHSEDVSALVASLPDGPFLGFFLGGAMRLAIEPPVQGATDDAAALAEEVELGATFLRQQFRGAELDRVTLVGVVDAVDDAESALAIRLGVSVKRFALRDLTAASHVAVGAVLDADSDAPLSFGGTSRNRPSRWHGRVLRSAALLTALAVVLLAIWAVRRAFEAGRPAPAGHVPDRRGARADSAVSSVAPAIRLDSTAGAGDSTLHPAVAPTANSPTVRAANGGRQLTSVLIADERRVAVIDDQFVRVGDVLRDGSRVTAIQPTGVWITEKNGKWRLLTISRGVR